jgi:tetratricopeptide (TPR) repeat protein
MMLSFFYPIRFKRYLILIMVFFLFFQPLSVYSQPQAHFNPSLLSPVQKGGFLLMQSLNEEALQLYESLITKGEGGGYSFRGLILAYKGMNELNAAKTWTENYLEEHPNSSVALYASGYVFYLKKSMKKAEELFKKALEYDANNALALNNLGAVLLSQNSYAKAVDLVRKAIRVNPKEPMFFSNLENIYKKMGAPELIIADYNFYLGENDLDVIRGYGVAVSRHMRQASFRLYSNGLLDEAILKWVEIERIYKKIDHQSGLVPVYFSLGLLYEEKGDSQNAKKYFNQVLTLNPLHIQAKERLNTLQ